MATEYELTLNDYLSIMRRRAPYLIGIAVVVFLASIITAIVIPPTFLATGTIMVESQQIPDNIVASAIRTEIEERISIIRERVLTRDSLLRIANKYGLSKEGSTTSTTSELIDQLRSRVNVDLISADDTRVNNRGKPTIAFTLSFEDKHPDIAYQVTNDLISLFLEWNVKLRTEGAADTADFLTQESNKLKVEVERLDKLIGSYKQENNSALPEQANLRMSMLTMAQSDMRDLERDYNTTKETLRSLETDLAAAQSGLGEDSAQSLPALKAEYSKLSATLNESHPDMVTLKRKIDALENASDTPSAGSNFATSPTAYKIQSKITSANSRLSALTEQKKLVQAKIDQYERSLLMTSTVGQGLEGLIRDRDAAQKKYEEIHSKQMGANISASLESENKSERFTLLDPPLMPDKAFKPNRPKIIAMGFFLSIASAAGALFVMATFDNRIRGVDALSHILGYRPLVVIPYLFIHEEGVRKKRLIKRALTITIFIAIGIAVAIHFLYMPLDVLLVKVLARLG